MITKWGFIHLQYWPSRRKRWMKVKKVSLRNKVIRIELKKSAVKGFKNNLGGRAIHLSPYTDRLIINPPVMITLVFCRDITYSNARRQPNNSSSIKIKIHRASAAYPNFITFLLLSYFSAKHLPPPAYVSLFILF